MRDLIIFGCSVGVAAALFLLNVVLALMNIDKKKHIYEELRSELPKYIKFAENAGFKTIHEDGTNPKLQEVLRLARTFITSKKMKWTENLEKLVTEEIENLLELPKKGGEEK